MSTYLAKTSASYQTERRNWLLGLEGTQPGQNPTATLDVSDFSPSSTFYPNGFIPSGTVCSRLASGLWGKFDAAAASGVHGILFGSITVPNPADTTQDVAGAMVVSFASIDYNKLPTGGRPTISALRTALPRLDVTDVTP